MSRHEEENLRLEAIRRLVEAGERIRPAGRNRQELAGWIAGSPAGLLERLLRQHEYALEGKAARGVMRRNIAKMTMTGSSPVEPGRANAPDFPLRSQRANPASWLRSAELRPALSASRHRFDGHGRTSAGNLGWSANAAQSGTRS